jgi:signal transduction histidine kinase
VNSIRSRLLAGLMLALFSALLMLLAANWIGARRELGALFDAHLQQSAAIVSLWTAAEPRRGEAPDEERFRAEIRSLLPLMQGVSLRARDLGQGVEQQRDMAYAILCNPPPHRAPEHEARESASRATTPFCVGTVSPNAPAFLKEPGAAIGFAIEREGRGGADTLWHVYTTRDSEGVFTVRVAERDDVRRRLMAGIVLRQLGITLPLLPLAGGLVWFVIGRGLLPLRRLSEQIGGRREQLLQPVTAEVPEEVKALVDALNQLFRSAAKAFDHERQFSAAVAHELRTPLSVIKTRAELASTRTADLDSAAGYLRIIEQCERAARVLDQLLELARVENGSALQQARQVKLAALAREVLADLSPLADTQKVELVLTAEPNTPALHAEPVSLSILLRNLLDNAIRHSPPQTEVQVAIDADRRGMLLRVCDRGDGMSAQQKTTFDAFMLGDTEAIDGPALRSDQTGYGLGLLLVQRIARLHGATVTLETPADAAGLCVIVRFTRSTPEDR